MPKVSDSSKDRCLEYLAVLDVADAGAIAPYVLCRVDECVEHYVVSTRIIARTVVSRRRRGAVGDSSSSRRTCEHINRAFLQCRVICGDNELAAKLSLQYTTMVFYPRVDYMHAMHGS